MAKGSDQPTDLEATNTLAGRMRAAVSDMEFVDLIRVESAGVQR